jgi:hypothetical protein
MIRVAAALNDHGQPMAVVLPSKGDNAKALRATAAQLGVTVADYVADVDRLSIDHAPGCYGGGVRPMILPAGKTGQNTPAWWSPSAGLGPAAVPREQFCNILSAVEGVLRFTLAPAAKGDA